MSEALITGSQRIISELERDLEGGGHGPILGTIATSV
jgi:hypothetical protein